MSSATTIVSLLIRLALETLDELNGNGNIF
jgi:hypothetical protein